MSKRKTKEEWIKLFKMYEVTFEIPKEYFKTVNFKASKDSKAKYLYHQLSNYKIKEGERRLIDKYKKWKMLDNMFMVKKQEVRDGKPKRDIERFVKKLTREQLEEIAKVHIKQNEKKMTRKKVIVISLKRKWLLFWTSIEQHFIKLKNAEFVSWINSKKKFLISSTKARGYMGGVK